MITESGVQTFLKLPVKRYNGGDGAVEVKWFTTDMSAKQGDDYVEKDGTLEFAHGEMEKYITVTLQQTPDKEPDENFRVTLSEVSPGAKLGHTKATVITIVGDAEFKSMVNRVMAKTHIALKSVC